MKGTLRMKPDQLNVFLELREQAIQEHNLPTYELFTMIKSPYMNKYLSQNDPAIESNLDGFFITHGSLKMHNTLGGEPLDMATFFHDPNFNTKRAGIESLISTYLNDQYTTMAEGVEFVNRIGNTESLHALRCLAMVNSENELTIVVIGGLAVTECMSEYLNDFDVIPYSCQPPMLSITNEDRLKLDHIPAILFTRALALDLFAQWIPDESIITDKLLTRFNYANFTDWDTPFKGYTGEKESADMIITILPSKHQFDSSKFYDYFTSLCRGDN